MPLWQPTNALARPAYYDRDPVPVLADYGAVVAPHAVITRWSYSPPNGFATFIETCNIYLVRITAAAPSAISAARLEFLPFTGGTFLISAASTVTNTVGEATRSNITSLGYMAFGDTLQFTTQDPSVGGSLLYQGSFKGTEFLY